MRLLEKGACFGAAAGASSEVVGAVLEQLIRVVEQGQRQVVVSAASSETLQAFSQYVKCGVKPYFPATAQDRVRCCSRRIILTEARSPYE